MYFADEIRHVADIAPQDAAVDERELELAKELIERFSGPFEPERYEDTYRKRLLEIIAAKREGKDVHAEPTPTPEEPPDLMAALRASLEGAQRKREPEKREGKRKPARKGPARKAAAKR